MLKLLLVTPGRGTLRKRVLGLRSEEKTRKRSETSAEHSTTICEILSPLSPSKMTQLSVNT